MVPDGSILPCFDKLKLIHCLENLKKDCEKDQSSQVQSFEYHAKSVGEPETNSVPSASPKIAIVDGMVLVQNIAKKSGTINTVKDVGQARV